MENEIKTFSLKLEVLISVAMATIRSWAATKAGM